MKREPVWRRYLRFWGPEPARDIDEEFSFHIAEKVDELIASGLSPEEAKSEAARRFGPERTTWKECYGIRKQMDTRTSRLEYFAGWWQDVRYAVRVLLRTKTAGAVAIFILALGIGANTATFTVLDGLLYKPLQISNADELVLLRPKLGNQENGFRYSEYFFLRDNNRTLSGIAGFGGFRMQERSSPEEIARPAEAIPVTGSYFETLRVTAAVGRVLTPEDDYPNVVHVAVASHPFATARFGAPADALGKQVSLNNQPFTIVGVLPESFAGMTKASTRDLYVPLATMAESYKRNLAEDRSRIMYIFARMKSGVKTSTTQADLNTLFQQSLTREPAEKNAREWRIDLEDGSAGYPGVSGQRKETLQLLAGIIALLLLMACVNVGCLMLARSAARRQEIAIRVSLGAGKARILRQILLESCLIAFAGGIAGLALAYVLERGILIGLRYSMASIDLSMDRRVLAFGFFVSLLTGILCGLAPAIQLLRGGRLTQNQQRPVGAFSSGRALVIAEIGLSVLMVTGAAMFLRGFQNLRSVPLGFDARDVAVVQLMPDPKANFPDGESENILLRRSANVAARLRETTGISASAVASFLPFNQGGIQHAIRRESDTQPRNATLLRVEPDYFPTLGITLASGRWFTARDDLSSTPVAILGDTLARNLFPDESPLGKEVTLGGGRMTVVGVTRDIKYLSVKQAAPELLYTPVAQPSFSGARSGIANLQIRTRIPLGDIQETVRKIIEEERAPLLISGTSLLADEIGASYFDDRVRMQGTLLLGSVALLLIAAGLYGLMAYWVAQRTREIGVRIAMGSTASGVVGLVLRQSLRLVLLGLLIGLPVAILASQWLAKLVFEAPPTDYASIAAAAIILLLTGLIAAAIPARRAATLDPVQALRTE